MSTAQQDFVSRVLSGAMLVRLGALLVALLGLNGSTLTLPVIVAVAGLGLTSFAVLFSPGVADLVVRHPILAVADVLVVLAVVAVLGVESPLVLVTFTTAFLVGVLFVRRTAATIAVVLVAGYVLAARLGDSRPPGGGGFMLEAGLPALYAGLVYVGAVARAAHERQLAAAQELLELRQAAAAADERARLAREMHDSVGKSLHGIALAAEALPTWMDRDPGQAASAAKDLASGASRAAAEARALLVRMRSDQPDRPLAEVLAERCQRWAEESGVPCAFRAEDAVDLCSDTRYEVLAVLGEALENVHRHARAGRVEVLLRGGEDGVVTLTVRDDGVGFRTRPDGAGPAGHYGLLGMRERAEQVGARLDLASAPGRGTTVTMTIPAEEK